MSNLLRDYILPLSQISPIQIQELRSLLTDMLAANWPELDTRPNSVAGDLIVTPDAAMLALAENAMLMLLSDLDLSNPAAGTVYNPAFVQAFLANFGVTPLSQVPSSGVIILTFSANQNYVIDASAQFTVNGNAFQIDASAGDPVVIYAADASNPSNSAHPWVLTAIAPGQFVVYLPVTGPAGVSVSAGSAFTYTLTQPGLVSVMSASDFDSGAQSETLAQMAKRAQSTFAASNLNTRSGAISFLTSRWPSLISKSVVITGDSEMKRAGQSVLGLVDGAMDIFIKSLTQYASGSLTLSLTYDSIVGSWVGALTLPVVPAFYDLSNGIFQTNSLFNSQGQNTVYSSSNHPTADNIGISFSKYEQLGLSIIDLNPQNFTAAFISTVTNIGGSGATLGVTGEYVSYFLNVTGGRSVTVRLLAQTTVDGVPAVQGIVIDNDSGENGTIYFLPNSTTNPSGGVLVQTGLTYETMLRGLNLIIQTPNNTFNPVDYIGSIFQFSFNGRTASFNVNYLYDPTLIQVDSTVQDPDNKPIGVDVVTRSFLPCYISQFIVNYRIGFGDTFDAATASTEIFNYINQIGYPNVYEESQIGQIVLAAGATGLISVSKQGVFIPSLASVYIDKEGNQTSIPKFPTNTLQMPNNNNGISARTVTYVMSQNTIQFNATVS